MDQRQPQQGQEHTQRPLDEERRRSQRDYSGDDRRKQPEGENQPQNLVQPPRDN